MKPSWYNFFFPYDDKPYIAFNGFTYAMALLEKEKYQQYQQFIQSGTLVEPDAKINILVDVDYDYLSNCEEIIELLRWEDASAGRICLGVLPKFNCYGTKFTPGGVLK